MTAILSFAFMTLLVLSVVYVVVSIYSRSVRREKLEKRFDQGDIAGDRDTYIEEGMAEYQHGLRRKLIVLVYIVPIAIVAVTVYLVNYN
jgi:Ca2+/Na+ antiporter